LPLLLATYLLFPSPSRRRPVVFLGTGLTFVILMSGNRTDAKDRKHATRAYKTIGHIEELVAALTELEGVSSAEE